MWKLCLTANHAVRLTLVLAAVLLSPMTLVPHLAEAIQYCQGDLSVDEWINTNGVIKNITENCSRLGLSCTDGIGCEPIETVQLPIIGFIIFMLAGILIIALKKRRR
jgi:hypothetical protein